MKLEDSKYSFSHSPNKKGEADDLASKMGQLALAVSGDNIDPATLLIEINFAVQQCE